MRTVILLVLPLALAAAEKTPREKLLEIIISAQALELEAVQTELTAEKAKKKMADKLPELKAAWDAVVKSMPGYKPGCGVNAEHELVCPPEEAKKK